MDNNRSDFAEEYIRNSGEKKGKKIPELTKPIMNGLKIGLGIIVFVVMVEMVMAMRRR